MKKIKCAILDDEPKAVQLLESYVNQTEGLILLIATTSFKDMERIIEENKADIVFLDIQMPEENGMDIIKKFNNDNWFILTTAYADYALEGYEYNVIDFLLKPISYERFLQGIQKFKKINSHTNPHEEFIFIRESGICYKLLMIEIIYIEGVRDYIKIYTNGRVYMVLSSLNAILAQLPDRAFVRIHRSYIINTHWVKKIGPAHICMGLNELPIGEVYKKQCLAKINNINK